MTGDIVILGIDVPNLIPGQQVNINVNAQFYKDLNNCYFRIVDYETGGLLAYSSHVGVYPVGYILTRTLVLNQNMRSGPWNIRVEAGVLNWAGQPAYPQDYKYYTLMPSSLPSPCPDPTMIYDPATGTCVAGAAPSGTNWMLFLSAGLLLGFIVLNWGYERGKKKS